MARILTGIQSSGKPHLGNILGAINPSIDLSRKKENESLFFIADLHSLINIKDPNLLQENTFSVASAWLAMGFDFKNHFFYRQSKITEVCELTWYLNCFTPFPMLSNSHSFKDKSENLSEINSGLFTYPVLMASDILLYDAEIVPVGKDQKQHLEITRDIAKSFNHQYGDTFIIPKSKIDENVMTIKGIDGRKMSKTYNNTIDIFADEKLLKKQVMSIVTDSKGIDDKKDPSNCNIYNLFKVIATEKESSGSFRAKGNLKIKGITNEVIVLFTPASEKMTAKLIFDRSKFNVRYGSDSFFDNLGNRLILNDVVLEVSLSF